MSNVLSRGIILFGTFLVLGAVNYSIHGKEQVIRHGETIFLELAPVDPRSLMQGDYMALRFQLAGAIESSLGTINSPAPIVLDERRVATLATEDVSGSYHIRYRVRNEHVWLGTNAYFFEEGSAARYNNARYGEFRVDRDSGEAVLVALRDGELRAL